MIWAGRRDHLVGDTTHLQDMPSSSAEEKRESLECSSIPRPVGSVTLQKRKEKKQKNTSALEVLWALMFFCLFSFLFCRVTLPTGLVIEDHSDDSLFSSADDEGMF